MKTKLIATATSLAAAAIFMAGIPAFAQTDQSAAVGVGVNTAISASVRGIRAGIYASTTMRMGSSTRPFSGRIDARIGSTTARTGSTTEERMQYVQGRGDNMISQRIASLNQLLTRIQSMKKLSSSEQASLAASIQTEITTLTNLETQVNGDTSTTSLRTDVASITKSYRVYALIEPQAQISAASDRILNIVSMVGTVVTKIQTRISSDATLNSNATIQVDLSDITSKTADATTEANTAVTETSSLQPDNGDTTVVASNTAALKDARTKVQTAQSDLQAAEKDVQAIIKIIVGSDKGLGASVSASTTTQ